MGAALPDGPPQEGNNMQVVHRSLRVRGGAAALVVASLVSIQPVAAFAADGKHVGLGAASAFCNLFYGPAKLLLMMVGSVTAGFGYAVTAGDIDVTRKILDSSVMGDYVIVPEHFTGQKPLDFIGHTTPPPADDWGTAPENSGF
jgi:hypothetical protein